jgi:hypothetical protein
MNKFVINFDKTRTVFSSVFSKNQKYYCPPSFLTNKEITQATTTTLVALLAASWPQGNQDRHAQPSFLTSVPRDLEGIDGQERRGHCRKGREVR